MLTRLKNHNDSLFIVLLLSLLSVSALLFNHNITEKVSFLNNEVVKMDKQNSLFANQNILLLKKRQIIKDNINEYLQLENLVDENNPENLKLILSKNPKTNELLTILPPNEIATIAQKESGKKITEDIVIFKEQSAAFWQSINQISNDDFSEDKFVIGNISDSTLKNALAMDIAQLLKQEKKLFGLLIAFDNDFKKFSPMSDKFNQIYPLLQKQNLKNKQLVQTKIDSLHQELYLIQLVSVTGFISLLGLLGFVIHRKKQKITPVKVHAVEPSDIFDQRENLDRSQSQHEKMITISEKVHSLVNQYNASLAKNINLHFDMDQFYSLNVNQQQILSDIVTQFITFSYLHSFSYKDSGDIIVSLKHDVEKQVKYLVFKDNGQAISIDSLKEQIKAQYGVADNVFAGKTDPQILSFIFKPGFKFYLDKKTLSDSSDLSVVNQLVSQLEASMNVSSKENQGSAFIIQFKDTV